MNYLKHYWLLINTRKGHSRSGYLELHHIVPKGVFGRGVLPDDHLSDVGDTSNVILLTGREHFVAHWLLHRAFPHNRNLAAGFFAMANLPGSTKRRCTPSSRAIEEARIVYSLAQSKAVARYSLTGELLEIHDTTKEAAVEFETTVSNISAACNPDNGVNNIAGFLWRRFDIEPASNIDPYINQNGASSHAVHQYDFKGNWLATYDSIRAAKREGVLFRNSIDSKDSSPQFSNGFYFIVGGNEPAKNIRIERSSTTRRRVYQIDPKTGEILHTWSSSREPQRELGICHVSQVCNGKRKTAGGFIWKWAYDESPVDLSEHKRKKPRARSFELFLNGESLGKFDSLRKAEESTGVNREFMAKARDRGEWKGVTIKFD